MKRSTRADPRCQAPEKFGARAGKKLGDCSVQGDTEKHSNTEGNPKV